MRGKDKCKALKEIRKKIAESNDIELVISECKHQGECKGTCPKCEEEVKYLERELAKKRKLGKAVVLAGVSTCVMTGLTACSPGEVLDEVIDAPFKFIRSLSNKGGGEVEGDVACTEEILEGEPIEIITEEETEDSTEEIYELEGDVPHFPEETPEEIE